MERGRMRVMQQMRAALPFGLALLVGCGGGEGPPDLGPATELGAIEVRWTLENAAGEAIGCEELGIIDAYVAVGGEPQTVECGEEPFVRFGELLPQRYPVVVRLRGLGQNTVPGGEYLDTVTVVGGDTATIDHVFGFDEGSDNTGALDMSWRIEGGEPMTQCAVVGGHEVRIETQEGSIGSFSTTVPCEDGEARQTGLRPGNYAVRFTLLDRSGDNLAVRVASPRVSRGSTAEASVSFTVDDRPPAALHAAWTITGSAAAEGCREDWTVRLLLAQELMQPIEIGTATAACSAGRYTFEGLRAPRNPNFDLVQITFFLQEPLRGIIDTVLVEELALYPSETTTVSVDLEPPP